MCAKGNYKKLEYSNNNSKNTLISFCRCAERNWMTEPCCGAGTEKAGCQLQHSALFPVPVIAGIHCYTDSTYDHQGNTLLGVSRQVYIQRNPPKCEQSHPIDCGLMLSNKGEPYQVPEWIALSLLAVNASWPACPMLLWRCLPHHDGLSHPQLVSQTSAFPSITHELCQLFCRSGGKGNEYIVQRQFWND